MVKYIGYFDKILPVQSFSSQRKPILMTYNKGGEVANFQFAGSRVPTTNKEGVGERQVKWYWWAGMGLALWFGVRAYKSGAMGKYWSKLKGFIK